MYDLDHDGARLRADDKPDGAQAGAVDQSPEDTKRPRFGRDYDRIVHTSAFRRLQGKTQVVSPGQADFFRTRLTHTIEVAQIARRLAWRLCESNGSDRAIEVADVCEAAATMHDLGHPPFGHTGEKALNAELDCIANEWALDGLAVGGYEGNAQSFRQVVWSLKHAGEPGLHLTRASLDASIKYPRTRTSLDQLKWNYYPSETWAFDWVKEGADSTRSHSFEAEIMEWADDIAYATHDIDDWYRAGYMPLPMLTNSDDSRKNLAQEIMTSWDRKGEVYDRDTVLGTVHDLFTDDLAFDGFKKLPEGHDGSSEAKNAIRQMRGRLFSMFINDVVAGGDVSRGRYDAELDIPKPIKMRNKILKAMLWIYVIEHPRMATHQYGQREAVRFLVRTYAAAAISSDRDARQCFPRSARTELDRLRAAADVAPHDAEVLRLVADHVGGMTDSYATMMHRRLTGAVAPFNEFT